MNLKCTWITLRKPLPLIQVCVFEAYADLYVLTGAPAYLAGVLGGWAMFRDPLMGWMCELRGTRLASVM
jgi:hypothetical protein